jgi:hypothetical protein
VTNPALSILAEGFATAAGLSLFRMTRSLRSVPKALAVSAGWRLLFLLAVFILPVQKGILLKGSAALATFLIADSTVNAVLIGVPYWARMPPILPKTWEIRFPSKLWAAGALAAAIGTRIVFSSVP